MKTPYQQRKQKRDKRAYDRYIKLSSQPGAMKSACIAAVMKEFGFAHHSTMYGIIRRAEAKNQASV